MACYSKNCTSPPKCCTNNNVAEKVCIDTKRVFDVCVQRISETTTLTVDFDTPVTNPSVIKVVNSGSGEIVDLNVEPIPGCKLSRVEYTLEVPILVEVINEGGGTSTGTAIASFDSDIVLNVPEDGVFTPTVDASAVVIGTHSTIDGNLCTTTLCVTIITKVVADVILVVPAYGYPVIPPCQKYKEEVCTGIFDLPIFPS